MSNRKYKIVFRGDIEASADIDEVKKRLVKALKTSPKFVDSMFEKPETCLKKNLRQELAQKLKDHLQRTGARFVIVPEKESSLLTPTLSEVMMSKKSVRMHSGTNISYVTPSLFLLVFVLAFAVQLWASWTVSSMQGPSHMLKHEQSIYVVSGHHLLNISEEGQLHHSIALSDLGFFGEVADINIDQEHNLWIGDVQAQSILRCDLKSFKCLEIVQLKRSDQDTKDAVSIPGNFEGNIVSTPQFSFRVVPEMNRIYVSETSLNRMRMFDLHGEELFIDRVWTLFPRKLFWKSDELLMADWGNQRIVSLDKYDVSLKGEWFMSELHQSTQGDIADESDQMMYTTLNGSGVIAPMQIISDGISGYWLLCSNLIESSFKLWHFDKEMTIIAEHELLNHTASAIAYLDHEHLLIADKENIQLIKFEVRSGVVSSFGSSQLLNFFQEIRDVRDFYQNIATIMLYLMFFTLLFAIICFVFKKLR